MVRSLAKGFQAKMLIPLVEVIELHKPFKRFCFNYDPDEMAKRTRGIQINVLVDHKDQKISIWDLAGQEEYHAFHDAMIPDLSIQGNVCYFVLVCNPFHRKTQQKKNPTEIHNEIHYWLRFISSNTKRSLNSPPQVLVVLTNGDKGFQDDKPLVETRLKHLKQKFAAFVDLSPICHLINAHFSQEAKDVVKDVMQNCASIFKKMSHIYKACMNVQHGLSEWNQKHPHEPIVTMKTFDNDIVHKVEPNLQDLRVEGESKLKPHEAIAMFLHDAGEVIYFKDEDFLVVNPNWFCNEVMGHLIMLHGDVEKAGWKQIFQDGFGNIEDIQNLIKLSLKITYDGTSIGVDIAKYLIRLMLKMDLAYYEEKPQENQDAHHSLRIFVPTTLKVDHFVAQGERSLQWTFTKFPPKTTLLHLGRRLQCHDQELTTLTPGFFPRVQVKI
jgi:GTPase SAR1 family protein